MPRGKHNTHIQCTLYASWCVTYTRTQYLHGHRRNRQRCTRVLIGTNHIVVIPTTNFAMILPTFFETLLGVHEPSRTVSRFYPKDVYITHIGII